MKNFSESQNKLLSRAAAICTVIWGFISIFIIGLSLQYSFADGIIISGLCGAVLCMIAMCYDNVNKKYLNSIKEPHRKELIDYLESGKLLDEIKQTDDSHVIDYWHKQLIEER